MKYRVVIEKTSTGFSAYSPDLPGCVSAGATREETEANMREAVELHVEGLRAGGAGGAAAADLFRVRRRRRVGVPRGGCTFPPVTV